jgi:hypothetical protein
MSNNEKEIKQIEARLKEMKEKLKDTVDINYGRYNNEYTELAYQREVLHHRMRDEKAKKAMDNAAEESADRLYNKLRGTINI